MWFSWQLAISRRTNLVAKTKGWPASRINGFPLSLSSRNSGTCWNAWAGMEDMALWLRSSSTRLVSPAKAVASMCRREQRCRITRCKWVRPSLRNWLTPSCVRGLPLKSNTYTFQKETTALISAIAKWRPSGFTQTWTVPSSPLDGTWVKPAWWQATLSFPPFHLQTHGLRQLLPVSADPSTDMMAIQQPANKMETSLLQRNIIFDSGMSFL